MKNKYLVTGGAGFIGSHLCEKLVKRGHKVVVIDNLGFGKKSNLKNIINKIEFIKLDISNYLKIEKYFQNVKKVFHLAALSEIVPSINKPEEYFKSNVEGTLNVLKACKKHNVSKIIYAASSSCYGLPKFYPTDEKEKINPQYPYALTKKMGEDLILHWEKVYKLKALSLRLFNVYGPRSRSSGAYGAMFGVFLTQKYFNKPFTVVGDGNQERDFTYVEDVVEAFIKASSSNLTGEIFNIGSGKSVKINEIVRLLGGKKIHIPKRPGEPDMTFANTTKIKKMLNWKPKINIEKGIKILMKDIHYWKNSKVWTPTLIKNATKEWFKYLK